MKKKYLILVDGLFALLGSAINVFGPVLILAMGMGAYKYTIRFLYCLKSMECPCLSSCDCF